MSDAWDGRPVEPGRDGAHWVSPPWGGLVIRYWYAGRDEWSDGFCDAHSHEGWSYLGPVLQPAEVAAREAAAWCGGRDAAAGALMAHLRYIKPRADYAGEAAIYNAAIARIASVSPPADLAAAAATCDAVAVEREAIAAWLETHVYVTSNVNGARMEPSKRAGDDMHHRTIAAAIRARGRAGA